jgi:hypothetical protein
MDFFDTIMRVKYTVILHRSDAKFDTWCSSVLASQSVKFSTDAKVDTLRAGIAHRYSIVAVPLA